MFGRCSPVAAGAERTAPAGAAQLLRGSALQLARIQHSRTPGADRLVVAQAAPTAAPVEQSADAAALNRAFAANGRANGSTLVRFGFPKGSLQKSTQDLFARAGFKVNISERGYFPSIDDSELSLVLFRSQEIGRYVEDGILDCGICGRDWIVETGADVVEVCELRYSKATSNPARWVLAVREDSPVRTAEDLAGTIIASELVETTKKFFADRNIAVQKVEYSFGATEVKASLPGVGGIVDITETGSSLVANKLRVVDTILSSTTRLVANKAAWEDPAKRQKIEDVALLLQAAINGKQKVGLKMNIHKSKLNEVTAALPSAQGKQSPTISPLIEEGYIAVEIIVEEATARQLIPFVRRLGATGVLTYPVLIEC